MTKTRRSLEDAMNGDLPDMNQAAVRALRVIADDVDEVRAMIEQGSQRIQIIAGGVLVSVISAVILLALGRG